MTRLLLTFLITLPMLGSALILLLRRIRPAVAYGMTLGITGLATAALFALLPHAGSHPVLTLYWLPGTGPMDLSLGATGLYAALVTAWALLLTLLGVLSRRAEFRPLSGAIVLFALSATCVAFLTEHFLARYVALETVALCIALILLVEMPGMTGFLLSWRSYLLLRLGDAGLLAAILMLFNDAGTLDIKAALAAAAGLDAARLGWIVAGFLLAIWVKVGGWPFYVWSQPGRRLALTSHAWLYATVMPNLAIYLLYRVSPLLAEMEQLRMAALWWGAGGMALSAILALTQADTRTALVHVAAVQGGLMLFMAATGLKSAIWLSLLAVTPLRLLLFLVTDAVHSADSAMRRRMAACLFALGGFALAGFCLLSTWWARKSGAPLDTLFVAEAAIALIGIWTVRMARQLARPLSETTQPTANWIQWAVIGLLAVVVLASGIDFRSLLQHLTVIGGLVFPDLPSIAGLVRYVLSAPALWGVATLAGMAWHIQRRSRVAPIILAEPVEDGDSLEEGLARASQILREVVEVGVLERLIALTARWVLEGARITYRIIEKEGLEGVVDRGMQTTIEAARATYHVVEQKGLEGVLYRFAQAALRLGRSLQRWHTGRLRHNLLWVSISMALAVLVLVLYWW